MTDIYNDVMLRRWSIDPLTGQPECLHDAVDVRLVSAVDRYEIELTNASVREADAMASDEAQETDSAALLALRRIRAGEPLEGDVDFVTSVWISPEPTRISAEDLARLYMPDLKPYQFRAVIELAGLSEIISDAIANIPNPVDRIITQTRFEMTDRYRRTDPLFAALASGVGVTAAQIDDLWLWAAAL